MYQMIIVVKGVTVGRGIFQDIVQDPDLLAAVAGVEGKDLIVGIHLAADVKYVPVAHIAQDLLRALRELCSESGTVLVGLRVDPAEAFFEVVVAVDDRDACDKNAEDDQMQDEDQALSNRVSAHGCFSTLYPTPQTTFRYRGSLGLISIFSRMWRMWTATVLSAPIASSFQIFS